MRDILFRGKTKGGAWLYGGIAFQEGGDVAIVHTLDYYKSLYDLGIEADYVIPETVGEFTGLYNGAGQRIFEDDIVRFEGNLYRVRREDETPGGYWASTAYILQHIGWDDYMSFVDTIDDFCNEICVEIIGNIHDNPELLAAEADQKAN